MSLIASIWSNCCVYMSFIAILPETVIVESHVTLDLEHINCVKQSLVGGEGLEMLRGLADLVMITEAKYSETLIHPFCNRLCLSVCRWVWWEHVPGQRGVFWPWNRHMDWGHQHDIRPQRSRSGCNHGAVPKGPEPVSETLESPLSLLIKDLSLSLSLSQPVSLAHSKSVVLDELQCQCTRRSLNIMHFEAPACFVCIAIRANVKVNRAAASSIQLCGCLPPSWAE